MEQQSNVISVQSKFLRFQSSNSALVATRIQELESFGRYSVAYELSRIEAIVSQMEAQIHFPLFCEMES